MPWDIELYHPYTNAGVSTAAIAAKDAAVHLNSTGDSIETNIEIAPETMPEHVRHFLRLTIDASAKFFGVITKPVNRNAKDQNLTLNIAGARKRLYEHPMTESYVPGGDVGAMVRAVLGNAVNIPVGLSWANSGASTVPDFSFVVGDRVTKRSESVGAFLDAMAQLVPGFVVPSAGAEYDQMIEAFPEMAAFSAGDVVLGAVWGVLPSGAIFFSRRDTTNSSLVEGTNCFIDEQDTFDAEKIVTSIRWIIDRINLQGHAYAVFGFEIGDEQQRFNIIQGAVIFGSPTIILAKHFNFDQNANALSGAPIHRVFGLGEVISYDAPNISLRNKYGLAYDVFQLSDYEPAFKALAIAANWVVVKGGLLTGAMADLKTGVDPITVTTNIEGYFVMSLDIADITLYDGFYINAPDAEVAWYLYNLNDVVSAAHYSAKEVEAGFAYGKASQINLFSKKALLDSTLTHPTTSTKRLTVTMKFTDGDGVGNFIDVELQSHLPYKITLEDSIAFEYKAKEDETFILEKVLGSRSASSHLGTDLSTSTVDVEVNAAAATLPIEIKPNDVITFLQTTGDPLDIYPCATHRKVVNVAEGYIMRFIKPIGESTLFLIGLLIDLNDASWAPYTLPAAVSSLEEMRVTHNNVNGRTVKVRVYSTPTISRTIYGAYLVEKDTGYLRRIAQNLYKTPSETNMTIYCDSFVEPTRRLDIAGRGVLYPTKFVHQLDDENYQTVITVGEPEKSDDEARTALIEDIAKRKASDLNGS